MIPYSQPKETSHSAALRLMFLKRLSDKNTLIPKYLMGKSLKMSKLHRVGVLSCVRGRLGFLMDVLNSGRIQKEEILERMDSWKVLKGAANWITGRRFLEAAVVDGSRLTFLEHCVVRACSSPR